MEDTTWSGGATLGGGSTRGCRAMSWTLWISWILSMLLFFFTVPAAVKDPKHCNYTTPFINDLVNNVPKERFGNGLRDFACGLDVLICTDC